MNKPVPEPRQWLLRLFLTPVTALACFCPSCPKFKQTPRRLKRSLKEARTDGRPYSAHRRPVVPAENFSLLSGNAVAVIYSPNRRHRPRLQNKPPVPLTIYGWHAPQVCTYWVPLRKDVGSQRILIIKDQNCHLRSSRPTAPPQNNGNPTSLQGPKPSYPGAIDVGLSRAALF